MDPQGDHSRLEVQRELRLAQERVGQLQVYTELLLVSHDSHMIAIQCITGAIVPERAAC